MLIVLLLLDIGLSVRLLSLLRLLLLRRPGLSLLFLLLGGSGLCLLSRVLLPFGLRLFGLCFYERLGLGTASLPCESGPNDCESQEQNSRTGYIYCFHETPP